MRPIASDLEQPEDCSFPVRSCQESPARSASRGLSLLAASSLPSRVASLELLARASPDTAAGVQEAWRCRWLAIAEPTASAEMSTASCFHPDSDRCSNCCRLPARTIAPLPAW